MTEDELESPIVELIEPNKLIVMVKESGLEQTKAEFILTQFQDHFKMAAEWAKKAKKIIVTDESQIVNMKMARTGRLFLREERLKIETARKALKESALREGQTIDRIAGFLKDLITPTELHLERQEKFVEFREKAKEEAKRLEIEKRMEEEKSAEEKKKAEETEKLRVENEKLKKESEAKQAELDKLKKENERKERERVQAEQKEKSEELRKAEELKSAGDVAKLSILKGQIMAIYDNMPEVKSFENQRIIGEVRSHLFMATSKIKIKVEEEEF